MALCTITGFVYMPNGQPAAQRLFKFKTSRKGIAAGYFGAIVPEVIEATTDELGFLTVQLLTGDYVAFSALYNGPVTVPDAEEASLYEVFGGTGSVTPPAIAPNFTVLPSLLGSTSLGGTITVDLGTATGSPEPVITGTLTRPGASPVAVTQGQLITVQAGDQGGSLSLTATAANSAGVDTETVSRAIPAAIPAPVFTTPLADVVLTFGDADVVVNLDDYADNATSYSVSPAGGAVTISGTNMAVSAAAPVDQLYVVTATGPGGTATDTFGVLVEASAPSTYLGVVATNLRMPTASTTSNRQFNSRSHHKARDNISALQINLPGWWWQQASGAGFTQYREHPTQGSATYRASIEYPEGTFTQLTFGGNVAGTSSAGQDMLSDSVPVAIPEGASFWVRVHMVSTWGMVYFVGDSNTPVSDQNYGERMEYAASGITDKTMGGVIANTGTSVGRPLFSPIAIIAQTSKPSLLLVGDSRVWGQNDTFDADGNKGELARGLGPHFGYINVGSAGDSPSNYLASNSRRTGLAQWCSHVVSQAAINALRSGTGQNKTAATVLSEQQQILSLFPGKSRLATTTMTRTTSTDSWATVANQTPIDVSARIIEYNEAIRAGVPSTVGYFEIADTLESARNSARWRAPGFTIDGLHATPTGYAATVAGVDISKVTLP